MAPVFAARKGQPAVEIMGAGVADADHQIPLDRVAAVAHELQDKDGKPLTGKQLVAAAEKWGEPHGLEVREPRKKDQPADVDPSPAQVAIAAPETSSAAPAAKETK